MIRFLDRLYRSSELFLRGLACIALFAMMLVTMVDVVGRYAFNKPVTGALEGTEFLLVVLIFGGLPSVSRADQHIKVDLIAFPLAIDRVIEASVNILACLLAFFLCYVVFQKASSLLAYGDTTAVLSLPLAPVTYFMAALLFLSGIGQLLLIGERIRREKPSPHRGEAA
ncbi:TRAP transporter small permease [Aquibium sp. LZ166]|uniref:TRAP transporter small permease protein n=1 Tax=Aquibium pacificus TaxID=3153579 RepID=A0ABV3SKH2_9HYPH